MSFGLFLRLLPLSRDFLPCVERGGTDCYSSPLCNRYTCESCTLACHIYYQTLITIHSPQLSRSYCWWTRSHHCVYQPSYVFRSFLTTLSPMVTNLFLDRLTTSSLSSPVSSQEVVISLSEASRRVRDLKSLTGYRFVSLLPRTSRNLTCLYLGSWSKVIGAPCLILRLPNIRWPEEER